MNIITHSSSGSTPTRPFDTITIKIHISGRRWSWIAYEVGGGVLARQSGEFLNEVAPEIAVRFVRIKAQAWQLMSGTRAVTFVEEVAA